ncbi:MAG: hypothetical protein HQL51_07755 [Magnetococcales bacterium]|nr:hypothetical protein [Magnetococcales bacterium]
MKTRLFSNEEEALFQEALNQGALQASAALTELLGEAIRVAVITIETPQKRPSIDAFHQDSEPDVSVVTQIFHADIDGVRVSGCALLSFPDAICQTLCGYFLAQTPLLEQERDVRRIVLAETGNILLNATLGGLANFLHIPMENELPDVHLGREAAFRRLLAHVRGKRVPSEASQTPTHGMERRIPTHLQERVLQAKVEFGAAQTTFHSRLLIFFDSDAVPMVRKGLDAVPPNGQETPPR